MKQVITSREQTTAEYYLRYMVENNSKRKLFCKEKYICIPAKVALEIAETIEKSREKVSVIRCEDCYWYNPIQKWCEKIATYMEVDDYCRYGERKDG